MKRSRPLRICLLGYRSDPAVGGQGVYLYHLSRNLVDAGHKVDVVSGDPLPELDPRVRLIHLPGLNLYEHGLLGVGPRPLSGYVELVEWFSKLTGGFAEPWSFCQRVAAWFRKNRADYDIVHDNQSLGSGLLSLSAMGVPVLATIHHPITRDLDLALRTMDGFRDRLLLKRWYSFVRMQRRVARSLPHVVAVSHATKRDVIKDFGLEGDRVSVVHNGIDTEMYKPLSHVRREGSTLMAVVSSGHPLKGLRYLLLAFSLLRRRFASLKLLLVGKLPEHGEIPKLIRSLELGDHIQNLYGLDYSDMVYHYARAGIVVVPSLYEGFGFPAGEAMACGAPLVCTDGGALSEVVADAAVTVPAGRHTDLAEGIELLLRSSERRRRSTIQGRQRVLNNFSWRRTARDTVTVYDSLLTRLGR